MQDCMTLFQAGLLIKSHDFLNLLFFILFIYFLNFHYCVRPLYTSSFRLPPTGGQYEDGAGLSKHSNTHDTHTKGEHGPSLSKSTLFQQQKNNSTTVEADTKPAFFF